jgi:tetratricopeptide (TPR) repeat protein
MRFIVISMLLISTMAFGQRKKKDKEAAPATTTQQQQQPVQQPAAEPQTQTQPADTVEAPSASMILTEHYLRKYSAASRWNDPDVAKDALYDVIVENPGIDSLIYTLAYYYYENEKFASSLLITQDLLGRDGKNPIYLELAGSSAQQLGVNDRALQFYESLYLINDNIRTLYQIAFLQFNLKRSAECKTSIDILLANPKITTEKAMFQDAKGNEKEYPLKVSVLNLKGLLALDQKDKEGAKKAFNEALAISPDFALAKANLEKTK